MAGALVVAILLMLGATTGVAFAHELQHAAHHTAALHATGIIYSSTSATKVAEA